MIKSILEKFAKSPLAAKGNQQPASAGCPSHRTLMRRKKRLSDGFFYSHNLISPYPCSVRDMTPLGGRIDMWSDVKVMGLKGKAQLFISGENCEVDVKVVWQRGKSVGLSFLGPMRPPSRQYGS